MDKDIEALKLEREFLLRLLELSHHDDVDALLDEALSLVVRMSGAKHGYIEIEPPDRGFDPARFSASTEAIDKVAIRGLLSSTIMRTALAEGTTVETRAAHQDPRFSAAPSVRVQKIDAVVCVPIGSKPLEGVLYLQAPLDGGTFTPTVVRMCELFARHLSAIAPSLVRKAARASPDPTARWREKLVGSESIIGTSQALAEALKSTASAAPRDIGVLITGPSGSGKTMLAGLIATNGTRSKAPFLELNCANLEANLLESELFGAMPGSHSTANRRIIGKVEAANSGTLFLDEVAELTPAAQAKLLQFIQDGTYYPLGATRPQQGDVRIIAATNTNLLERVKKGLFREDLFYRLCVIEIVVPSLEDRRIDIAPLAERFLNDAISRLALPALHLSSLALRLLESTDWPGNIRQLKNGVEAAAIRALADDALIIDASHVMPGHRTPELRSSFHGIMRSYQKQVISDALGRHNGNVAETAAALGLGRSSLYQLIKTLGMER